MLPAITGDPAVDFLVRVAGFTAMFYSLTALLMDSPDFRDWF